jgi:D-threo-aldose 1-dehydrogenase
MEKTRALEAVCAQFDVPLAAAAMQFPLGHPAVASLVIGCSSPQRIASNLAAMAYDIPAELWATMRSEELIAPGVPLPGD